MGGILLKNKKNKIQKWKFLHFLNDQLQIMCPGAVVSITKEVNRLNARFFLQDTML